MPRFAICGVACRTFIRNLTQLEEFVMKRFWVLRGLKFLALAVLAVSVLGYVVMWLWNAVIPGVTGFHAITYLQGLALLVLSRILFGGLRGRARRGWHWRNSMQQRWQQMTPEE